ncbi:MAG TPA: type II toxin-antitoxin system VapC family toxin [Candidatus Acidoferrales bacterium]|nr:type II toxin-antitoxin system VapC family toxin [Candidatus Acidoferrales bacterium]
MNFLLDTNVVSEWVKPQPDPNVLQWFAQVDEDSVWLSVITFAELRLGVERMAAGRRRTALAAWLENDLPARFEGRIIGIGLGIADAWGKCMARCAKQGRAVGAMDGFLGAMVLAQGFTLVTRNTEDFAPLGIPVLNPWTRIR